MERERQALDLFRDHRRELQFLASSRCPLDGGLLGAACALPDGLWVWMAGGRMSPSASWEEFRSQYLDDLDESDTYEEAAEYAEEQLREWGGRLQRDPAVLKVPWPASDDRPIMTWNRHSPEPVAGAAMHRVVTCSCRKHYLLPALVLIYTPASGWQPDWPVPERGCGRCPPRPPDLPAPTARVR